MYHFRSLFRLFSHPKADSLYMIRFLRVRREAKKLAARTVCVVRTTTRLYAANPKESCTLFEVTAAEQNKQDNDGQEKTEDKKEGHHREEESGNQNCCKEVAQEGSKNGWQESGQAKAETTQRVKDRGEDKEQV